jgi:hypothetical protein
MPRRLQIENYSRIERASIDFDTGFNGLIFRS